ncbi:hypothetical protein FNV43_RR20968 [Rhamnella rubrinervis]|uniref:Uncharacterized protein n=1 Tax=Rhamnella rubrinervis TaxID=2594499 RepID=A0A8K0GV17_9ROSA|nr:hypothetical protein FNV43_RR20968 [Rhamnella rubrinervis]
MRLRAGWRCRCRRLPARAKPAQTAPRNSSESSIARPEMVRRRAASYYVCQSDSAADISARADEERGEITILGVNCGIREP